MFSFFSEFYTSFVRITDRFLFLVRTNHFLILGILPIKPQEFLVDDKYFVDVTCFLTFNVCAFLGSLLSTVVNWVSECGSIVKFEVFILHQTDVQ